MKAAKPEPKKKPVLEPIPPKKGEDPKRPQVKAVAASPPPAKKSAAGAKSDAPSPAPAALPTIVKGKGGPNASMMVIRLPPAMNADKLAASDKIGIAVLSPSPMPSRGSVRSNDSPLHSDSADSPQLSSHDHDGSSHFDASPASRSFSGRDLLVGSRMLDLDGPMDLAAGLSNASFGFVHDPHDAAAIGPSTPSGAASLGGPALTAPGRNTRRLSSIVDGSSPRKEKPAQKGSQGSRLSVPNVKAAAAATGGGRRPRRKSAQQIQAEAAAAIRAWYKAATMRRNLKFLVTFVKKFVAIQEQAHRRRVTTIVGKIARYISVKVHAIRQRKEEASQNYAASGYCMLTQRFLRAWCSRAIAGEARRSWRDRCVATIIAAWRGSPMYARLRLLDEFQELQILLREEQLERREKLRQWLAGAINIKNDASAISSKVFVDTVLYRARTMSVDFDALLGTGCDDDDSIPSAAGHSRPLSPHRRSKGLGLIGSKRHQLITSCSIGGSRAGSRAVSPIDSTGDNASNLNKNVSRLVRSASVLRDLEAEEALLTPLWRDHLAHRDPHDAHLDKVDSGFFAPDKSLIVPMPSLKRKMNASGAIIGHFWEQWYLSLDGTTVFCRQPGAPSTGGLRTTSSAGLLPSRRRTRFASCSESIRYIVDEEAQLQQAAAQAAQRSGEDVPVSSASLIIAAAMTSLQHVDFVLPPADVHRMELDLEKLLIMECITRQRIAANGHRLVKDILEKMLTERQRELGDLLPNNNSPGGRKKNASQAAERAEADGSAGVGHHAGRKRKSLVGTMSAFSV